MPQFFTNPALAPSICEGPLGCIVPAYADLLYQQGYTHQSAHLQLRFLADLSRWLDRQRFPITDITKALLRQYLRSRHHRFRPRRDDASRHDITWNPGAHVRCHGKGRKQRCTPLTKQMVAVLKAWLHERGGSTDEVVFPSARGSQLSSDGVQYLLAKHVATAQQTCSSLKKKRVSPHVLRHTAAMELLQAGVDRSVIALWLGHESVETTQIYLDANLVLKEKALA